jgi:hypothetical protein
MASQLGLFAPTVEAEINFQALPLLKFTPKNIPAKALAALSSADTKGDRLKLTCGKLDRKTYEAVAEVLNNLGGHWVGGKTEAFIFPYPISDRLLEVIQAGKVPQRAPGAYFPTPSTLADEMIENLNLPGLAFWEGKNPPKVLDPHGGQGALLQAANCSLGGAELYAVELDPYNVMQLQQQGVHVIQGDWLDPNVQTAVAQLGPFDLVLANPPFEGLTWAKHLLVAINHVTPGGWFGAITPTNAFNYQKKETRDFLNWMGQHYLNYDLHNKDSTGFPVDVYMFTGQCLTDSQCQSQFVESNGYGSHYAYHIMISLDSCRNFMEQPLDQKIDRLDEFVMAQTKEHQMLFNLDPLVKSQVIQHLIDQAKEDF